MNEFSKKNYMIRSDQMRLSPGLARPRQSQFTQLHRRCQMLRLEKCGGSESGRFHQMQIEPTRLVFQLFTNFFFFGDLPCEYLGWDCVLQE